MSPPGRGARSARVGAWTALPALAAICLIAAPTLGTPATPALHVVFRAPYPSGSSHASGFGAGGGRCSHLNSAGEVANATTGNFGIDISLSATGCPHANRASGVGYWASAGFENIAFVAPSTGNVTVSANWSGVLWLNASIHPGGAKLGQLKADWNVTVSILLGPDTFTYLYSAVTLYKGSDHTRLHLGASPQYTVTGLKPGKTYDVAAIVSVNSFGVESSSKKPGGYVLATLQSSTDVRLVNIHLT